MNLHPARNGFDPAHTFHALEEAAEEMADAEYHAALLERHGEILLANLQMEAKKQGIAIGLCKEWARSQADWATHVQGEAAAISKRSRARSKYQNLRVLAEMRRTEESSRRALADGRV